MTTLEGKSDYHMTYCKSDSVYKNLNKIIMPSKSLSSRSQSDMGFKQPFLPKLPKKAIQSRKQETHFINDFYIEPELTKSCNSLNRKAQVDFKGDLLKAKQVYLALNSSISGSVKHFKTSDTPWARSNSRNLKPCKSALIKNKIEPESYIRRPSSRTELSCHYSGTNSSVNTKQTTQVKTSSNLNKLLSELDHNPVRIKQFAEDLLNDHYNRSIIDKTDDQKPDIALHVFNSIWELHSYALANSPFLSQLLEYQTNLPYGSDVSIKINQSKEKSRTNIHKDYLDKLNNILLEINNPLIDKNSLAVAIGNLYHPDNIEVPAKLASGVLAAAHLLKFDKLRNATILKMSESLTKKTIGSYYQSFYKNHEKIGIELCEKWLEMHLIPYLGSSIHLRDVPLRLLTKTIKSNRLFTINEYETFLTIITWIFLNINHEMKEVPTESIMITYFSSFGKDKNLIERHPYLSDLLYSVRLYGITKSNYLNTIQQMNIYPNSYIVQIMMEIQQTLNLGGDMAINRLFETSALRQGFVIDLENENYSDVFSIYGFHFELIAEKVKSETSHKFQFYIQRLRTNDPILTYEQSQLEAFSLRNDRFCNYSINVQYWSKGDQVFHSTGIKKQRFGKLKTQRTPNFMVEIPKKDTTDDEDASSEIFVLYSLSFPPN